MKQFVLINDVFIAEKVNRRNFRLQHTDEVIIYSEKRMKQLDEETEALLTEAVNSLDFKYKVDKQGEEKRIYLRNISQILKDKIEALDYYHNCIIDHPKRLFDIKEGDKCILYYETSVYPVEIISVSDIRRKYNVRIYKGKDKGASLNVEFISNQLLIKDDIKVQTSQLENISIPSYDEDYTLEQIEEIYNKLDVKFKELVEKCKNEVKQEEEEPPYFTKEQINKFYFTTSDGIFKSSEFKAYLGERMSKRLSEMSYYKASSNDFPIDNGSSIPKGSLGIDPYSSRGLDLNDPESELKEDDEEYDEIDENEEDLDFGEPSTTIF